MAVSRKRADQDLRLELAEAAEDIEAGNLTRAASRVSNVLVRAPSLPEVHELLARLDQFLVSWPDLGAADRDMLRLARPGGRDLRDPPQGPGLAHPAEPR